MLLYNIYEVKFVKTPISRDYIIPLVTAVNKTRDTVMNDVICSLLRYY